MRNEYLFLRNQRAVVSGLCGQSHWMHSWTFVTGWSCRKAQPQLTRFTALTRIMEWQISRLSAKWRQSTCFLLYTVRDIICVQFQTVPYRYAQARFTAAHDYNQSIAKTVKAYGKISYFSLRCHRILRSISRYNWICTIKLKCIHILKEACFVVPLLSGQVDISDIPISINLPVELSDLLQSKFILIPRRPF